MTDTQHWALPVPVPPEPNYEVTLHNIVKTFDSTSGVLYLVNVRRYDKPLRLGLHLVRQTTESTAYDPRHFEHRIIGLYSPEEGRKVIQAFMSEFNNQGAYIYGSFSWPLQRFIRQQVIPLEFKSMTDAELSGRVGIQKEGL